MHENQWLTEQFEQHRPHLRAVAYRMLGSLNEAEDAVQESWLRINRADSGGIHNPGGWLTTVVARVCLDMLRARKARREDLLGDNEPIPFPSPAGGVDPEQEALLADSLGLALLVVLERLTPVERVAFVLHDVFAVPFDEIAPIVDRSPSATRQIASRARRRVRGGPSEPEINLSGQRRIVDAFLAAARGGDFETLLNILDPDVVLRSDHVAVHFSNQKTIHGAQRVAGRAVESGARAAQPALVDGAVGLVIAPQGRLTLVLSFTISPTGKITAIDAIADPGHLNRLTLTALDA